MFKGILIEKDDSGYRAAVQELDENQLPEGDVMVRVSHSTLNYKDGLAITGRGPVVRKFPLVPGIDLVGTVEQTSNPSYKVGDQVVLNGWGVGESHWGGLAQKARLKGDWLVPLPAAFSSKQAMAIGTAGYTAMLCVMALERHGVTPEKGEILVTGAAGGVGSVAVAILSKLGYTVVGSHTLANVCATTRYGGVVTACGLAGGMDLPASVAPFILRGVTLAGVDSVMAPRDLRLQAWQRLTTDLDLAKLGQIAKEIGLNDVVDMASKLLNGQVRGRVIVDVNA